MGVTLISGGGYTFHCARFEQAWALLSKTYRQDVTVPDNVVAFPCRRAA